MNDPNTVEMDDTKIIQLLAALIEGDRWLCADSAAVYLGLFTPKGKVNRRGFLERVACRPDFPKANPVTRSWRKSDIDRWSENQKREACQSSR